MKHWGCAPTPYPSLNFTPRFCIHVSHMDIFELAGLYPSTGSSSSEDSDATYVMDFCAISSGDIMPVTTPYILRKRDGGVFSFETTDSVYRTSKNLFLKRTSGNGMLVKKIKSSSRGYGFRMLSFKDRSLVLKSVTRKKVISILDITSCKNHGSTLTIYTKCNGVITLIMRSVTEAYAFSNVLG